MKKIVLLFCPILMFIVLIFAGCVNQNIPYLDDAQNDTIASARAIKNTDNKAYEINYTADYKASEFIDLITKEKITSAYEIRTKMKDLIAPKSKIFPLDRLSNSAPGCSSVICKNADGQPVIGRNYDLDVNSNGLTAVIHTSPNDGYKSVGVSDVGQCGLSYNDLANQNTNKELFLYAPYFTMDGVNETGFACSIMILNEGQNVQDTGKNWLPATMVVRYLLDHADSVENAIELLNSCDYRSDYFIEPWLADLNFHWALTDKSGNKAVVEFINGKMCVNKYPVKVKYNETTDDIQISYPKQETGFLLSTNFYVSEGFKNTVHDAGKWRYQTLDELMSKNPTPTKDELKDVMKSVKFFMNDKDFMWELRQDGKDVNKAENWEWETVWTDILNTDDLTLTFYLKENFDVENVFYIEY